MDAWKIEEPKWHFIMHQLLSRFQQQGILCDTTLACSNGESVKAHSCILAAASQRIRNLLDGVQSGDYTLQMGSVTSSTWNYILRFIYDGHVSLPSREIQHVKDAAIRFQIAPLVELIQTLEKLQNQENATRREIVTNTRLSHVQQDSSEIIVLDDDNDDDEINDVIMPSNQSASVNLSCSSNGFLGTVNSVSPDIINIGDNDHLVEAVCQLGQSQSSSAAVSELPKETYSTGHDELGAFADKSEELLDNSEDNEPHNTNCNTSESDVTYSDPVKNSSEEQRNESSNFASNLIVPVSCFANVLNSGLTLQSSSSELYSGFCHPETNFSDDKKISEFNADDAADEEKKLATARSVGAISSLHMDSLADVDDEGMPLLHISDVVSLSGHASELAVTQTDGECANSVKMSKYSHETNALSGLNFSNSFTSALQTIEPDKACSSSPFFVPASGSTPVLSKSLKMIPEDLVSSSVFNAKMVPLQNNCKNSDTRELFIPGHRKLILANFLATKTSQQGLNPSTQVFLLSNQEKQKLDEIAMDNMNFHDSNSALIQPHVIEPINDTVDSSLSETHTLQSNNTELFHEIVPKSVATSYISVPLLVQEFSNPPNLAAVPSGMQSPISASQKRPALLRHPNKNHFGFFANGAQTPRKRMCKRKTNSKNKESSPLEEPDAAQETLPSLTLGSPLPKHDSMEYAWPGHGQFGGCSKLASVGGNDHETQADQSSSIPRSHRRKISFTNIRSDAQASNELKLTSKLGNSSDHNYFMQPDSTVNDSQAVPLGLNVYNFTDSDADASNGNKGFSSVKGALKTSKGPKNKQNFKKISPAAARLDNSNKPLNSKNRKQGRHHNPPSEEQSLREPGDSGIQFVGKKIRHEWVISKNPRTTQWYQGQVVRLVKGIDGMRGSQYEVQYEGEAETYLIDHLLDDYNDGSLVIL